MWPAPSYLWLPYINATCDSQGNQKCLTYFLDGFCVTPTEDKTTIIKMDLASVQEV